MRNRTPTHVARQARHNNCPVLSIHRNYGHGDRVYWELLMGTDETGGFKVTTSHLRRDLVAYARDISGVSDGYITAIWCQHGTTMTNKLNLHDNDSE